MAIEARRPPVRSAGHAAKHPAREARVEAESGSGWYAGLARTGLVAKGISFLIVGVLAIELTLDGGKATSRLGALQTLAESTFGMGLLGLLAFGFPAYAIWRFVQAFAERDERGDRKRELRKWGKRSGFAGRGLTYGGLTFSTIKIFVGSGQQQSQGEEAHRTAGMVLGWPGGPWIVGALDVAVAGVGLAIGLDGALQQLSVASYGPYLLGLTAVGLVCYGIYCFVDGRYRDVSVEQAQAGRTGGGNGLVITTN
jgi:Domain of Unknown Function (DUF1206)